MSSGSGCWESGGPDWLFLVGLWGGFIAFVGLALTLAAWLRPSPPKPLSKAATWGLRLLSAAYLVLAVYNWWKSRPSWSEGAFYLAVLLLGLGAAAVIGRWQRASAGGPPLTPGWRRAHQALKWALPVIAVLGLITVVASIAAGLVLGRPC